MDSRKKGISWAFSAALALSIAPHSMAASIDLYDQFPDSQGENGFYVYDSNGQLLSDVGSHYFARLGDQWNNPQVFKAVNSWLGAPWIGMFPAGTASSLGADDPRLVYIAPKTGTYQLDGSFYVYPQSANGAYAYIVNGQGTAVWQSYLSPGAEVAFAGVSMSLNAGDSLYIQTDAYNNVGFSEFNDWPFLRGAITYTNPVPELPPFYLLSAGLFAIGALRWTKNQGLQNPRQL